MTSRDTEQSEIVEIITKKCDNLESGKLHEDKQAWNKFKGDVTCRVVKSYMEKHMPENTRISNPNAFIEDLPNEFDLLVVEHDAKPREFSNCFESGNVKSVIEIKKGGVFSLKDADTIRDMFNHVTSRLPHIKCAYLTIEEAKTTRRSNSINFYNECKERLAKHGFFALKDLRGNKSLIQGEWAAFLDYVFG